MLVEFREPFAKHHDSYKKSVAQIRTPLYILFSMHLQLNVLCKMNYYKYNSLKSFLVTSSSNNFAEEYHQEEVHKAIHCSLR